MKMKKYYFGMMAMALALTFTSCSSDDDENTIDPTKFVTFEKQTLNAQKFWCGEENGNGVDNGWGGMTYACTYKENFATLNTTYGVSYWTGYAISARTEMSFAQGTALTPTDTPDQFNNVTGKAHSGKQFAVVYGQAATITVSNTKGVNVKGFFFTNSSYLVNSVENGDDYAKKFADGDYLKVTVTADNGKSVDFYPADYRTGVTVVKDWKWLDLSSLDRVKVLTFTFDGTDKGSWGLNTPSYVCIDDLTYEVE